MIIKQLRLLFTVLWCVALGLSAQTREVVAVARSEAPILVGGAEVPGEGNVFIDESVMSYYLPAALDYLDGSSYILGIGSAARLSEDWVTLDGVSLEIVSAGPETRPIRIGPLEFRPSSDCRATLLVDGEAAVTAHVSEGQLAAYLTTAEVGQVAAHQAATFTLLDELWRMQENRGPLEMSRILLRQLNYLFRLQDAVPPFERRRRELISRLVEASGGVLTIDADIRRLSISEGEDETPTIDPERLRVVAAAVSREIHHSIGWASYGCGKPACISLSPVEAGNLFGGDARLIEPQPFGCILCAPDPDE